MMLCLYFRLSSHARSSQLEQFWEQGKTGHVSDTAQRQLGCEACSQDITTNSTGFGNRQRKEALTCQ